jgi:hypothetical protein
MFSRRFPNGGGVLWKIMNNHYVDNPVDKGCPQVVLELSTCEQAVGILWISRPLNFCAKTQKLSTAYPHRFRRPASPSTPTMFEHECIITRFG